MLINFFFSNIDYNMFYRRFKRFGKFGMKRRFHRKGSRVGRKIRKTLDKKSEFKVADTLFNAEMSTTGVVTLVNGLTKGTDESNRIGRKVQIRSIQVDGNAAIKSAGLTQIDRVMLVKDRQPNGALPTVGDIVTGGGALSVRNLDNRKRFKILWDHQFELAKYGTGQGETNRVKKYFKKKFETVFNSGDTGTIGDINTNALYFVVVGTGAPGTTAASSYYNVRVRFTDM